MTRELRWCGSVQADLSGMPDGVRRQFDRKLQYLRNGQLVSGTKPWNGCGPGGKEFSSGGYRLVVTDEFPDTIYALHAFKKDGSRGRKTRKHDSDTARRRYLEICVERGARATKQ